MQNSTDLITVLSADNRVLYQSPSIEGVLGYTPAEVTGEPFASLLHPSEQGRLLMRLSEGAAGARSHPEPIECLLAHRDGGLRQFEILHTNLLDDAPSAASSSMRATSPNARRSRSSSPTRRSTIR